MTDEFTEDPLELVRAWLVDDGWAPELLEDGRTYQSLFGGRNADILIYARVPADIDVLLVYGQSPFDIPADTIERAAEFVARANYGMFVGSLELDMEGGDLRFRNSLDFRGLALTPALLRNTLLPCAYGMDRYFPAVRALVVEGKSPAEALALLHE